MDLVQHPSILQQSLRAVELKQQLIFLWVLILGSVFICVLNTVSCTNRALNAIETHPNVFGAVPLNSTFQTSSCFCL
jgi:hypothetical protein